MSNFSDKRKLIIFDDSGNNNNINFDPFLFTFKLSDGPDYNTQFYIEDNILNKYINKSKLKNVEIKIQDYNKHIHNPDFSLPDDNILFFYNINNYDDLIIKISELAKEENNNYTIFRIVSLYISIQYEILKKDNNTLIKILKIIFKRNINDNKIGLFINEWFSTHDIDSFDLDICKDFDKFFSNQ
jgi:hypothetical protein